MAIRAKLSTKEIADNFSYMLRSMSALVNKGQPFDHRQILLAETGVILKQWAGKTKVATIAETGRRARLRELKNLALTNTNVKGAMTVNAGWKSNAPYGRVWIKVAKGRKFALAKDSLFSPSPNRFGKEWTGRIDALVSMVPRIVREGVLKSFNSIGLARQSVIQIADALGIDLMKVQGPGLNQAGLVKAMSAMASTGRMYRNGTGVSAGDDIKPYIDLFNSLPFATSRRLRMDRTLIGIVHQRTKHFQKAYERGAFDSMKKLQRAYPNLIKVAEAA